MTDREFIKAELQKLQKILEARADMYIGNDNWNKATNLLSFATACSGALELLKAQEAILLENQHKPYGISTNANSPWISRCPRCGKKVEGKQTRFCKYCGQAVKWDDMGRL